MLTEEYKGYQINLEQDNDAFSPREDFDNLGTLTERIEIETLKFIRIVEDFLEKTYPGR